MKISVVRFATFNFDSDAIPAVKCWAIINRPASRDCIRHFLCKAKVRAILGNLNLGLLDVVGDKRKKMSNETNKPRWGIAPYFPVADVVATANYYRDQLGFHYERFWNEPPSFCMVKRNGIVIMLAQLEAPGAVRPNRMVDPEGSAWDAYIWIDNADALYAEFKSKGVKIAREICDQIYGCRDFEVEDCNGYRLCFGQDLAG